MSETVGDFIVERLHAWGVRKMFGYPGDGINGVFGAMNRAKGKIEFIQARHEEMAAFMASAYAKFTGELGVCIATSGPGRFASDHRALRRPPRSHAGARDRRAAGARRDRRPLPAGSRSRQHVQGCGRRLRPAGVFAGAGAPPRRPRGSHRDRRTTRHRDRAAERPAGRALPRSAAQSTEPCIRALASPGRGRRRSTPIYGALPTFSTPARRWRFLSAPARSERRTK